MTKVDSNVMQMTSESDSESFNNSSSRTQREMMPAVTGSKSLRPSKVSLESKHVDQIASSSMNFCNVFSWAQDKINISNSVMFSAHSCACRDSVVESLKSNDVF